LDKLRNLAKRRSQENIRAITVIMGSTANIKRRIRMQPLPILRLLKQLQPLNLSQQLLLKKTLTTLLREDLGAIASLRAQIRTITLPLLLMVISLCKLIQTTC